MYKEIEGDLIALAKEGAFDTIAHGVNCMCVQGAGIAKQMVETFHTHRFPLEEVSYKGDINKLGQIEHCLSYVKKGEAPRVYVYSRPSNQILLEMGFKEVNVVNCYTQYNYGANHADGAPKPLSYDALRLCLTKLNHIFKGYHIGLPKIGCGLAGGDWNLVRVLIMGIMKDCNVTIVTLPEKKNA